MLDQVDFLNKFSSMVLLLNLVLMADFCIKLIEMMDRML